MYNDLHLDHVIKVEAHLPGGSSPVGGLPGSSPGSDDGSIYEVPDGLKY